MSKLNKDNYIWLKSHIQEIVTALGVVTVALILLGTEKHFGDKFAGEIGIVFITLSFLFASVFYFLFNKATNIKENMQIVQGFSKFTDININDYNNNMSNAKNLLKDIYDIVEEFDQQAKTSASVEDASEWEIKARSEIRRIELNSDQIWIISNTLEVDTSDELIQANVIENLKGDYQPEEGCKKTKGRYCYIIPKSIGYKADELKNLWRNDKDIPKIAINNVRFIEVESDSWLQAHDITIYNALTVAEKGLCEYKKPRIIEFLEVEGHSIYRELPWEEYKSKIVPAIQKEIADYTERYKTTKGCWHFNDLTFNQALDDAKDRGEIYIEDLESAEFSIDEIQSIKDAVEDQKLKLNHLPESEIRTRLNEISKIIKQVKA